jgi:hypothetical protein
MKTTIACLLIALALPLRADGVSVYSVSALNQNGTVSNWIETGALPSPPAGFWSCLMLDDSMQAFDAWDLPWCPGTSQDGARFNLGAALLNTSNGHKQLIGSKGMADLFLQNYAGFNLP